MTDISNGHLDQHIEDIQDIISIPPAWLVRWGITILFVVLVLLLMMSSIIHYPEIIRTEIKINAKNLPGNIIANGDGMLNKVFVHNGEDVKKDQILAYTDNAVDPEPILQLNQQLAVAKNAIAAHQVAKLDLDLSHIAWGQLTSAVQAFYSCYLQYRKSIQDNAYHITLQTRSQMGGITEVDRLTEISEMMAIEQKKMAQSIDTMITYLEYWQHQHIIKAPTSGKLSFTSKPNTAFARGQKLFFINPEVMKYWGDIPIPQYNMGKIRPGQVVLIKLDSFPFQEFGIIQGKLEDISDFPDRNNQFSGAVSFNLPANYPGITLKTGMVGSAEIITGNASLWDRLTRSLVKILKG